MNPSHPLPNRLVRSLSCVACFLALLPVHAADEATPLPAKQVVAKFVKAIGGREAVLKCSSIRLKGTFEMAAQGLKGDFEMATAKPDKMALKISIGGLGDIRTGYDGKVGWAIDPVQGPMALQGKMLDQIRDQAHFLGILHEEANYKSMGDDKGMAEKTTFEGKPAYKIRFVRLSGLESTEYFDSESWLQVGMTQTQESPMGAIPTTSILGSYKKFGDIQMPTRMTQKIGPMEQTVTIDAVEYDKVPASEFALPDAIKALSDKAPAAQ